MSRLKNHQKFIPLITVGTIIIAAIVGVWVAVQPFDEPVIKCQTLGREYTVLVQDNVITPSRVDASRCDVLKIVNAESNERTIMFGEIDNMKAYNGVTEKQLESKESVTMILYTIGDFSFHSHRSSMSGSFSVR